MVTTCSVIATWFLTSPSMIHPVLAHNNFLLTPLVAMTLVWFRPVQPMIAASVTLGLFAVNWTGWRIAHDVMHTGSGAKWSHLQAFLSLACASAVVVFLLSQWRCKPARRPAERSVSFERSGVLSDDEFSRHRSPQLVS